MHMARELELASIMMLNKINVNKRQHVDARLHVLASECPLTLVDIHYKSNRGSMLNQNDNSIPIGALSRQFPN